MPDQEPLGIRNGDDRGARWAGANVAAGHRSGRARAGSGRAASLGGWSGGTAWINPATLTGRANLAASLLSSGGDYGAGLDPHKAARVHGVESPEAAGRWLVDLLVQGDIPHSIEQMLFESVPKSRSDSLRRLTHMIVTLLEFQLA